MGTHKIARVEFSAKQFEGLPMPQIDKFLDLNVHITRTLKRAGLDDTPKNYLRELYTLQEYWEDDPSIGPEKAQWLRVLNEEIEFYKTLVA